MRSYSSPKLNGDVDRSFNIKNLVQYITFLQIIPIQNHKSIYQEEIISISKYIKSKKDSKINMITSKENIVLQQYKNVFIQISDLSKKSFHINAKVSKTFSQEYKTFCGT